MGECLEKKVEAVSTGQYQSRCSLCEKNSSIPTIVVMEVKG